MFNNNRNTLFALVLVASATVVALVPAGCGRSHPTAPLVCHVGGTMQPVMEAIVEAYTNEAGQAVEINSAGSGELLAHIDLQKSGDVYVCHDPFLDMLMKRYRMGTDGWVLGELTPVIVVRKGNPKGITGVKDLTRPDVELILTDYEYSTLGRMLGTIFGKAGIDFEQLNRDKEITTNKSGGYAANFVKTGNADAAIVWNAVAQLRRDALDIVSIEKHLPRPDVDTVTSATGKAYPLTPVRVTIATLTCSTQPAEARAFAEFVASEKGERLFEEFGFTVSGSEKVYEKGEEISHAFGEVHPTGTHLKLYAGAGLRPAVAALVAAFERRTGVAVEPDYGGSGIILSRARASADADLFMPGDVWYVDRLHELAGTVASKRIAAWFVPVIIAAKGNPKRVARVEDLFRDDVSAGIGLAKACQIGRTTTKIFEKHGLDRGMLEAKESLTVNELGVWVKMKDVDAAIVWDAIAANIAEAVDVIEIPREKNVISQVPIAVLTTSRHKASARQFADFVAGDEGRAILKAKGYRTEVP